MASKSTDPLSNNVLATLRACLEEAEEESLQELTAALMAVFDAELAKRKPKFGVLKAPVAAPATGAVSKKGKPLSNYQTFVSVISKMWKGELSIETLVTPVADRVPTGKSANSLALRETLLEDGLSLKPVSFNELVATVRATVTERMSATGVLWLLLNDEARGAVCSA